MYPCRLDDQPATATLDPHALTLSDRQIPWVDVDGVLLDDTRVVLSLAKVTCAVIVRWARGALIDPVVHDEQWEPKVRAALA